MMLDAPRGSSPDSQRFQARSQSPQSCASPARRRPLALFRKTAVFGLFTLGATTIATAIRTAECAKPPSKSKPAAAPEAPASSGSYLLTVTRDRRKHTRVAANFWSGEYPSPVIDVLSKTAGELTVPAVKNLRDRSGAVRCTISHGVYHPWSKTKSSAIAFYQIIPLVEYQCLQRATVGETPLKKGDKISRLIYLGEGICQGVLLRSGRKEITVDFPCEEANETRGMKLVTKNDTEPKEQWLYLSCKEGYKAFIRDEDLLAQPGVGPGTFDGYGSVKAL